MKEIAASVFIAMIRFDTEIGKKLKNIETNVFDPFLFLATHDFFFSSK
jgi:hypothetical protein